jgi:hypothetical protein
MSEAKKKRRKKEPLSRSDKIAAFAVIMSLASLVFSAWTFIRQNSQWNAVNLSRVKIIKAQFTAWATIPKSQAMTTNWGYEVFAEPHEENGIVKDELLIQSNLVPFDPTTNRNLRELSGLTMAEVNNNFQSNKVISNNLIIRKHFQFEFDFENVGATDARQMQVSVQARANNSGEWTIEEFSQPVDIVPNKTFTRVLDLYMDSQLPNPQRFNFITRVKFINANNETVDDIQHMYFASETGELKMGDSP